MSHPLKAKIARLRRRARRLMLVQGLSRVVAVVLAVVLVLGLADYVLRFQDRGIRMIATAAVVTAFGWTCYRNLLLPLAVRFRDVDLARRLQRRHPPLGDRLASAVEFLDQADDDAWAGSASLRRAVIAQATAEAESLDFQEVVTPAPTRRAAAAATALVLAAATVVLLHPMASAIAVTRLANPLGQTSWPQKTHLALRKVVDRVAEGQLFEVQAIDRFGAKLPSAVHIHYRFEGPDGSVPDGSVMDQTQLMQIVGRAAVARRENVVRPFAYRVEGGDDDAMPWISVEVVEPPTVTSLAVTLIPPDYTGWPSGESEGDIRALVGTRVEISAAAGKTLASAALLLEDGRRVPATIAADGRRFTLPAAGAAPLVIETSGGYWFDLVDGDGIHDGRQRRWEIRAVPDESPTVTLQRPDDTVFVTPTAIVPLRITAKDDLAVHSIALEYQRSDRPAHDPAVVPLYTGPPRAEPSPAGPAGDEHEVLHSWQLAPLNLSPGTQLTILATAADYRPQSGSSRPRRVVVIAPDELNDRIASRQSLILSELARVLQNERTSRAQVAAIEIRLDELDRLEQLDLDHLHGAELIGREATRTLIGPGLSVVTHIESLLADLENNKIDSPDLRRRMEGLLGQIERLAGGDLPAIQRALTSAVKTIAVELEQAAEPPADDGISAAASLAAAGRGQDRVIAALEQMLGELARWDDFRRFHRDIGQLVQAQEELSRRIAELARQTLGKDLKDLAPHETAQLKTAAGDQRELARRLDRLQQSMEASLGDLRESEPAATKTLSDALDRSVELALSSTLRAVGDHLEQNRLGQAATAERQALDGLRDVLDILANRAATPPDAAKWSELEKTLQGIRDEQEEINARTRALEDQFGGTQDLPAEARREYTELSRRQARLAELLSALAAPADGSEDTPGQEDLP